MPLHEDTPDHAEARVALVKGLQAQRADACPAAVHLEDWAAMLHMRAVIRDEVPQVPAGEAAAGPAAEEPVEEPKYTPADG